MSDGRAWPRSRTAVALSGVLAATLLLALGGCGERREEGSGRAVGAAPRPADAEVLGEIEPCERGGTIVVGALADPKTLNPVVASTTNSTEIISKIFDRLVEIDCATLEYLPALARAWEVSDDGLRWTFALRRGILWADGEPFTAADVEFTFRAVFDERTGSPEREGFSLDGEPFVVTAVDSHTVVITTPRPFGPMLHALATGIAMIPRHRWEADLDAGRLVSALGVDTPPSDVFGTGPYRLEAREPGRTLLTRNPNYWKFDRDGTRLPYADRVVFVSTGSYNAWRLKFEAKEVDTYSIQPEEVVEMIERSEAGGYTVHDIGPRLGTLHFWFNQNPGAGGEGKRAARAAKLRWFRSLLFRRAVSHAIDRDAIVETVYRGHGIPIWGPISPADRRWYNPDIPRQEYDPARARALLAQMGLRDGDGDGMLEDPDGTAVGFVLLTNIENQMRVQICRLIEEDLARVGIAVRVSPVDFNTLVTTLRETRDYDACLLSKAASGDPSSGLNHWLSTGRSHFFDLRTESAKEGWERQVDSLATASVSTPDFAERKRLFDQVQVLFAENLGFIYLANENIHLGLDDRFVNVRPGRLKAYNETVWNVAEIGVTRRR